MHPVAPAESRRSRGGNVSSTFAALAAALAVVFAVVAMAGTGRGGGAADEITLTATEPVAVELTEFAITPAAIQAPAGGALHVTNGGAMVHNLEIRGTDLKTADIAAGGEAHLELGDLAPGEYEVLCYVAGHESAGMKATLTVLDGGAGAAAANAPAAEHAGHGGDDVDYAAMDAAMVSSILEFPAATESVGGRVLEPTVLPDGTKQFDLTAEIIDWEVEPGKVVEAWAYNGQVPAPTIHVEVGDRVRVNLQNDLPMGTDIHWHGIRVPFAQDGVAPVTQALVEAGGSHTYEFTATEVAVGMYHPHHHAQMQVVNGMLGAIIVGELPLPEGRTISGQTLPEDITVSQELPMVLNDAGAIGFSLNGKSFPATAPVTASQGDWILVHYLNEGLQIHPMHLHQMEQLVIAKDGEPLDHPYYADTVNVAPGERYSVLVNAHSAGTWMWHCHILNHVETDDGMFGMVTAMVVE